MTVWAAKHTYPRRGKEALDARMPLYELAISLIAWEEPKAAERMFSL